MYQIGSIVIYGIHGVCSILETEVKKIDRKNVEYYVLQPLDHPDARYYIPVHSPAAVSKMHPILTKAEIDSLFSNPALYTQSWIEDENERKQLYKTVVTCGDRSKLIGLISMLHNHRKQQLDSGRKFHACDENFLRDAEKIINGELSLVLNIPRNEVGAYIHNFTGKHIE